MSRLAQLAGIAPGMMIPTADPSTTDPPGWLICNGRAVSRTTYAALFAIIGTTWGAGDGSTTFNIPDLRGRAPIGSGTGAGLTARTVGQDGGAETHQLTVNQLPSHGHPFRASYTAQGTFQSQTTGGFPTTTTGDATENAHSGTAQANQGQQIGGTGGDQAHNNMQPFAVVRYIIKV